MRFKKRSPTKYPRSRKDSRVIALVSSLTQDRHSTQWTKKSKASPSDGYIRWERQDQGTTRHWGTTPSWIESLGAVGAAIGENLRAPLHHTSVLSNVLLKFRVDVPSTRLLLAQHFRVVCTKFPKQMSAGHIAYKAKHFCSKLQPLHVKWTRQWWRVVLSLDANIAWWWRVYHPSHWCTANHSKSLKWLKFLRSLETLTSTGSTVNVLMVVERSTKCYQV